MKIPHRQLVPAVMVQVEIRNHPLKRFKEAKQIIEAPDVVYHTFAS